MTEENAEKHYMDINDFIDQYCHEHCDRGGEIDCCCSLDGSCAKSDALRIELTGASGD